jgi:opacity protein-like surface antigen
LLPERHRDKHADHEDQLVWNAARPLRLGGRSVPILWDRRAGLRARTDSGICGFYCNATFSDSSIIGPCAVARAASGSAAYADSATRLGWSAGAGVEAAVPFVGNWTWRAEYLFVDFGTITTTTAYGSSVSIPALTLTQLASASVWHSARVTDNIVRFGLNYRFGGESPIVASY